MGKKKQVAVLVVMVLAIFMAFGGQAFADGNNGPNPPAVGDPIAGNTSPHGGYSTTTNYCMQCHGIHSGTDYSLLRASTVTATCNTCHGLYNNNTGTGAFDSSPYNPTPGVTVGTASSRAVYQLAAAGGATSEHGIGTPNTNGTGDNVTMYVGGWSYGWRSSGR